MAWAALALLVLLVRASGADPPAPSPAPRRAVGDRLPAVARPDPATQGLVRVDDLLWIRAEHVESWERGLVFDGRRWVARDRAPAPRTTAEAGHVLRTDHVLLRTNVTWTEAERLAREAQRHVERFFASYGEPLDLRFPGRPVVVLVHARLSEFTAALRRLGPPRPGWGAFYDASSGVVHVSAEPAPAGDLPLVADLRHEMTHQLLDLSRARRSGAPLRSDRHLALWEGFAVAMEKLGDGPGEDRGFQRRQRLRRRLLRREITPLARLLTLGPQDFEGRHYDQAGALVAWLLAEGWPQGREAVLTSLREVICGVGRPQAWIARLGGDLGAVERAWLDAERRPASESRR